MERKLIKIKYVCLDQHNANNFILDAHDNIITNIIKKHLKLNFQTIQIILFIPITDIPVKFLNMIVSVFIGNRSM